MRFKTWCGTQEIELLDCPFCGMEPLVRHIGNDHSKMRKIVIRCANCRCERIDAALKHGFDWLENVAAKNWNQRPKAISDE